MAHWMAIGLLALAPQLASAQASVSVRVDQARETVSSIALSGDYRSGFQLWARPATLSLNYAARRDWLGATGLDSGHSSSVDLGWQLNPAAAVGLFGSLAQMNFDQDGANARLESQDGATSRAGIRGTLAFDYRRQTLQGTLAYVRNDAEGANFVSRGPAAGLQYTHLLGRLWSLVAGADYSRTRYTEYAADPARESALYGCRVAFQGRLLKRLSASFAYALSRLTWNQDPLVRTETMVLSLSYTL